MAGEVAVRVTECAGRRCASSGAPWEPVVGYSRAVRSGNWIAVGGTVGLDPDGSYPASAGEQARRALAIIRAAVEALGGKLDLGPWEKVFYAEFDGRRKKRVVVKLIGE